MSETNLPRRLAEIAALMERATLGPWESIPEVGSDNFANSIYGPAGDYDGLLIARVDQNGSHDDARLIIACVALVRDLLAERGEG